MITIKAQSASHFGGNVKGRASCKQEIAFAAMAGALDTAHPIAALTSSCFNMRCTLDRLVPISAAIFACE